MAELAGVLVGNYFLLECLSHEGIVETYRARPTTRGGYDVVLRLFRPQFPDPTAFREHFATEVEKVWRCQHSHIQPLLEFGAGDELLYSATVFPDAETLEQFLERQQGRLLPVDLVVQFVTQLCAALEYLHQRDIVHGNIQPSSILVRDGTNVLLTNFGLRRAHQDGEPMVAHIDEGNPAYVAPEQALGMLLPASDIYASGVLLYRLLGGVLPYEGDDAGDIALKHVNEPIPSLRVVRPDLPEALELVVRVALAKSSEARFPTAATFAQALLAAVTPDAPPVVVDPPPRRIVVQSRRTAFTWTRAVSLLILAGLLLGLGSAFFFVFSLPQYIGSIPIPGAHGGLFPGGGGSGHSPGTTPTATQAAPTGLPFQTPTVAGTAPVIGKGPPGLVTPTPTGSSSGTTATPGPGGTATPIPAPSPNSVPCVQGGLAIDGSPNLEPFLQQVNNDYQALCPGLNISLGGDGSRTALNFLQKSKIDVAASDLTAKPERTFTDHPVAALLYAIIVSPDVQVGGLSRTEIQNIYRGRITNWAQVGGPDEAIKVVLRPPNDAITAIFRSFILGGKSERVKGIKLKQDWSSLVVQAVAQIPGAISYVPLGVAQTATVHVLAIDGVLPSPQSLLDGSYPFWSVEHLYTQGDGTAQFQAYLLFLNSDQETALMPQFGVVPLNMLPQNILASHLPGPVL